MSENKQGMVIPFALSAGKMRRSAAEYRRYGQVLEALTLIRRAAEQDDSTSGWQLLAAELRQLGCWEAAAGVLARVLSREDCPLSAWVDMARCQLALGRNELANDCLNRPLQEDPWSPEGDAARELIMDLDFPEKKAYARRALRMAQRGMAQWQSGDRKLGNRRIRRALRLIRDQERLLVTLALMHMLHDDYDGALRYLARSLRRDRDSVHTLCTLSAVLQQMGHPRAARGFLRVAAGKCTTLRDEEQFLISAWAVSAWEETEEFLQSRLARLPYRAAYLNALATMRYEQERVPEAMQLWRQVMSIDPDDRQAATFMELASRNKPSVLPVMGSAADPIAAGRYAMLSRPELTAAELLKPGMQAHRVLLWTATSQDEREQRLAMAALRRCGDEQGERRFLRELLCRPGVPQNMSTMAVARLAEIGDRAPMWVLMGEQYSLVQCTGMKEPTSRSCWRTFLRLLLRETRRWGDSASIAEFAAMLWRSMSPAQRLDAAGSGGYLWCRAMEILWLRLRGDEVEAIRVIRQMPVSVRRVSRVLRQLGRMLESGEE